MRWILRWFRGVAKTTCPRRSDPGPWQTGENLDAWATDSWRDRRFTWKWHWQPRVCSFCGGAYPDDVLRLLSEGWEAEGTTKAYKRYLHPPGTRARLAALSEAIRARQLASHEPPAGSWSPVPPVKVYTWHFDEDQRERFNAQLAARHAPTAPS